MTLDSLRVAFERFPAQAARGLAITTRVLRLARAVGELGHAHLPAIWLCDLMLLTQLASTSPLASEPERSELARLAAEMVQYGRKIAAEAVPNPGGGVM